MRLLLTLHVFLLSGCALQPDIVSEAVTFPDGRAGHIVYCGGTASSMAECYDDARKICGGNYELLEKATSQRIYSEGRSTENRSIEIVCKP